MKLKSFGSSQDACASFQSERARQGIQSERPTLHGSIPLEGGRRFRALDQAADNGIEVIGKRASDLAENDNGKGERAKGGDGAKVEELGAGAAGLEVAGGDEVSLELLYVGEGGASLHE